MATQVRVKAECDRCGIVSVCTADTELVGIRAFKERGWRWRDARNNETLLCPGCVKALGL